MYGVEILSNFENVFVYVELVTHTFRIYGYKLIVVAITEKM